MLKKLEHILQNEIDPAFSKRSRFIFEEIEKRKPKIILDIGCGRGFYIKSLSFYKFPKKIFGIDINEKYLLEAKKNCQDKRITIKKGSIYSLPYPNNYFDFIICSELLEHLNDDKRGLKELNRVLKKNGTIAITVPNYYFPFFWDPINSMLMDFFGKHINKNIWWLAGIWADHERLYSVSQIKKLILISNSKIVKFKNVIHNCLPFSHFLLYGIGKNLVEKFSLRKFDRFDFNNDKDMILPYIFRFLSLKDKTKDVNKSSVNICLITKKV